MKKIKKNLTTTLLLLLIVITSCSKNDDGDTIAPSSLTVVSVTPTNGGGIIKYNLPSDTDISYVKAIYVNALGKEVFRVSSKHNSEIEINGLNQTTAAKVHLYVIDEKGNVSNVVDVDLSPLESYIFLVQKSIQITPDLGGVKITWDNSASKTVFVYINIQNTGKETIRILSSSKPKESIYVRGLESVEMTFSTKVEDIDGNATALELKATLKPLFEQVINKSTWTLISSKSVNGNAYEGKTINFWDNIIDTAASNADNSYFMIWRNNNGGSLKWPLDIVVDLNKKVKIKRLKVWQRAFWFGGTAGMPYYYQEENIKSFDLYSSNDSITWTLLGKFDIGNPRDGAGNIPAAALEAAAKGHDFSLDNTSEPFRYLKISLTSNYGSEQYINGSEITLYGLDNL